MNSNLKMTSRFAHNYPTYMLLGEKGGPFSDSA